MKALLILTACAALLACSSSPKPEQPPREPSSEVNGVFPLSARPIEAYEGNKNAFGAPRANRKNAGVSLVAEAGTDVRSMYDNGKVIAGPSVYYSDTYFIDVQYADGTVVRYGGLAAGSHLKRGDQVSRGSILGKLAPRSVDQVSSLHVEMYSGRAKGPLVKRGENEFQRRGDLIDPTSAVRNLERHTFKP